MIEAVADEAVAEGEGAAVVERLKRSDRPSLRSHPSPQACPHFLHLMRQLRPPQWPRLRHKMWRAHPSGSDTSLRSAPGFHLTGAPSLLETLPSLLSTLGDDELEIIFGKLPRSDPLP